jgi:hypothetical protein
MTSWSNNPTNQIRRDAQTTEGELISKIAIHKMDQKLEPFT